LARSTLVVFGGCFDDLLIGARSTRHGKPGWMARLIAALMPMPELMLVLDATADVHQAEFYRKIAGSSVLHERAVLIDAAQSLDTVVDECADRTLIYLESRTAKRLHLG
jgi:hypothetical protein